MTQFLYFLPPFLALGLLWFSAWERSYPIGMISGFIFFFYGIGIVISPLPSITSFINDGISVCLWGLGLFVILSLAISQTEINVPQ